MDIKERKVLSDSDRQTLEKNRKICTESGGRYCEQPKTKREDEND